MAKTMNVTLLAVLVIAAATVLPGTQAENFTVGDTTGWKVPTSGGASFYTTWAADKSFSVGDFLVFDFTTGQHDVAKVNKAAFEACTTSNTLSLENTGPANIPLNTTGELYFICTIPSHCTAGQKLSINVTSGSTSPPSPAGSTPPPPPPPPSSGASASSLAATLPLILMTVASAIFYDLF